MGSLGRGRGGIAPEEHTRVSFVKKRAKGHTGRGAVIGQYLVDGQQVKGDVASGVSEVVSAAERDATDAITRARIPRRYHKAVKDYFSDLQKQLDKEGKKPTEEPATPDEAPADESSDE